MGTGTSECSLRVEALEGAFHGRLLPSSAMYRACIAFALLLLGCSLIESIDVVTLVAGTGSSSINGDSSSATSAAIGGPIALVLDSSNNIYIGAGTYKVRVISAATGIITTYCGYASGYSGDGGQCTSAALGSQIYGLAIDSSNNLYIGDSSNYRVRKVMSSNSIISTIAGAGSSSYSGDSGAATSPGVGITVYGLAIDSTNNVYIADYSNHRIRKVTVSTNIITTIAGDGSTTAVDNVSGTSSGLYNPRGVAVDSSDKVYIADTSNSKIRVLSSAGIITTFAGRGSNLFSGDNGPATSATFNTPTNIDFDSSGHMFVADRYNYRIRKISTPTNYITTVAGIGQTGTYASGNDGTSTFINQAICVATDSSGNVYFCDLYNYRVRKLTFSATSYGPTVTPTVSPTVKPSTPTVVPTGQPSRQPSRQPTSQPSSQPTSQPSGAPSSQPTSQPSRLPSGQPTSQPSRQPSRQPTSQPSRQPSGQPSLMPTIQPSVQPTSQPTSLPTNPTSSPSSQPSRQPSRSPTSQPSTQPSCQPTSQPSTTPTTPFTSVIAIDYYIELLGVSSAQLYSDITEIGFVRVVENYFSSLPRYIDGLLFNYKAVVTGVIDVIAGARLLNEKRELAGLVNESTVYFQVQITSSQDYLPDDITVANISASLLHASVAIASSLAAISGLNITYTDIVTIQLYNVTFLQNAHTPFPSGQPTAQPSSSPTSIPTAPTIIRSSVSYGSLFFAIFVIVVSMFSLGEGCDRYSHHVEHNGKVAPNIRLPQADRRNRYMSAMKRYMNSVLSKNNRGIFSDIDLHSRIWYECLYNHCYLQLLHSPNATHWYHKLDQSHSNKKNTLRYTYFRDIESTGASSVWTRFVYSLQLYTNLAFIVTIVCLLYTTQYPTSDTVYDCPSQWSINVCLQQRVSIFDDVALCQWDALADACTMNTRKYDLNLRVIYLISLVAAVISVPVQTILSCLSEILLAPEPNCAYHNHLIESTRKAAIESLSSRDSSTTQSASPRRSLGGNFVVVHDDDNLDEEESGTKSSGVHSPNIPPLIRQISSFNSSQRILHQYAYIDDDTLMPPAIYQDAKYLYLLELLVPTKLQETSHYISNSINMIRVTLDNEDEINAFDDEYGVITVGTASKSMFNSDIDDSPNPIGPEKSSIESRLKYIIHSTGIYYKLMRLMQFSNATAGYSILHHFIGDLLEYNGGKLYKDIYLNKFQHDYCDQLAKTTEQLVYTKKHKIGILVSLLVFNIGFILVCYYMSLRQPLELIIYWIASIGIYIIHSVLVYEVVACLLLNVYLPLHAYEPIKHIRDILYHLVENYYHNPKPSRNHGTQFTNYIQYNYFVSNGLAKLFTDLLESKIITLYTSYRKQEHKLSLRDAALFDVIQQCNTRLVSNKNRTKIVVNLLILSGMLPYKWQKLILSVMYVCCMTLAAYLIALGSPIAAIVIHNLLAICSVGILFSLITSHSAVGMSRVVPESPIKHHSKRKLVHVEVPNMELQKSGELHVATPVTPEVNIRQIRKRKVKNMWRESIHRTVQQNKHKSHLEDVQQLWYASATRIQKHFRRMKARKLHTKNPSLNTTSAAPSRQLTSAKSESSSLFMRRHESDDLEMIWHASATRIQSNIRTCLAKRLRTLMKQVEGADKVTGDSIDVKGSDKVIIEPIAALLSDKSTSKSALMKQGSGSWKSTPTVAASVTNNSNKSALMKQGSGEVALLPTAVSLSATNKTSSKAILVTESIESAPAPLVKQTSILRSMRNMLFGGEDRDADKIKGVSQSSLFDTIKDSVVPNRGVLREQQVRLAAQQEEINKLKEAIMQLSDSKTGTKAPDSSVVNTPNKAGIMTPVKHYDFDDVDSDDVDSDDDLSI